MKELYTVKDVTLPSETVIPILGQISGHAWRAWPIQDGALFEYVSGELAGRVKQIRITLDEYQKLKSGQINDAQLLQIYGAF